MKKQKKILFVVGARPNFMKIAPLVREIKKYNKFKFFIIHTGQHYDYTMSQAFFKDLEIEKVYPRHFLNVGSGSHAEQTGMVMIAFEKVCIREKPDLVVVVGDVNSTLACTITAKKLNIKVAHIEAGLRSFDMSMPEEINRVAIDSICDFLFVTEESGLVSLGNEDKPNKQIFFVGNTMIDSLIFGLEKLKRIDSEKFSVYELKQKLAGCYGVITLHRPVNVDSKIQLLKIASVLNRVCRKVPLVFPVHPRTRKNIRRYGVNLSGNIHLLNPLGYLEFLFLYKDARFVLTDSGGIQEETTFLKIPCFTLRMNTERPVTIVKGTNMLVGERINRLPFLVDKSLDKSSAKRGTIPLWDGKAAVRIIKILNKVL